MPSVLRSIVVERLACMYWERQVIPGRWKAAADWGRQSPAAGKITDGRLPNRARLGLRSDSAGIDPFKTIAATDETPGSGRRSGAAALGPTGPAESSLALETVARDRSRAGTAVMSLHGFHGRGLVVPTPGTNSCSPGLRKIVYPCDDLAAQSPPPQRPSLLYEVFAAGARTCWLRPGRQASTDKVLAVIRRHGDASRRRTRQISAF